MRNLIVALVALLSLTACSVSVSSHPSTTTPSKSALPSVAATTPYTTPVGQDAGTNDEIYLATIETVLGENYNQYGSDADYIALAHNVCATLDNGGTLATLTNAYIAAGEPLPAKTYGAIIGAAVEIYCPDQESKVTS